MTCIHLQVGLRVGELYQKEEEEARKQRRGRGVGEEGRRNRMRKGTEEQDITPRSGTQWELDEAWGQMR